MAPPSKLPRLADLDALTVAADVCGLVLAHLARFAVPLSPGVTLDLRGDTDAARAAQSTGLGLTVQDLVLYAQTGDLGDWDESSGPHDALVEVCAALYGCAGEPGTFGIGEIEGEADVTTAIGVALVGACARWQIARREAVTLKALAVLAGLSVDQIDVLVKGDEIALASERRPRTVAAEEARRFLSGRGVPGFGKRG